jgi:carbamoyl-phosphate synthase small subunit
MHSLINDDRPQAALVLADGTVFRGRSFGARIGAAAPAEVVFNTSMTGYQEILTDPSYTGQIVALTYPHIGNVGVNSQDTESAGVHVAGLVVHDVEPVYSNFRAEKSLPDYLKENGVPGICGIDTRRLTRILREKGAQVGAIAVAAGEKLTEAEIAAAQAAAKAWGTMNGQDLAKEVTCEKPYEWTEGVFSMTADNGRPGFEHPTDFPYHVVAYDFGIKRNILRLLASNGMRVTVVPAKTPAADVLAMNPDGVFLSNGPGDPAACTYAIDAAKTFIAKKIPLFGICLGVQIMGHAVGGTTVKMKFGHHGANHPVEDLATHRVNITSQNHGFAVDAASLPADAKPRWASLFDGSLQGFELTDAPAFGFQGHPEASPGPHDINGLFRHFRELIEARRAAA